MTSEFLINFCLMKVSFFLLMECRKKEHTFFCTKAKLNQLTFKKEKADHTMKEESGLIALCFSDAWEGREP